MGLVVNAGLAIVGLFGIGYAARGVSDVMDTGSTATKWLVIGGGVYLAYKGAKNYGVLK